MEWLTKNFSVISAVIVFTAAVSAVFFLFAYLSTFDWRLIWLVEYSDLAKLFLIVGGLISGIISFGLIVVNGYYGATKFSMKEKLIGFGILVSLFLAGFVQNLYDDFHGKDLQNGIVLYHAYFAFLQIGLLGLLFLVLEKYSSLIQGDRLAIFSTVTLVAILVLVSGTVFGQHVKYASEHRVTIWTKREEFQNAKVIMWLSHHVVFYTATKVIVLPTADVVQMELQQEAPNARK